MCELRQALGECHRASSFLHLARMCELRRHTANNNIHTGRMAFTREPNVFRSRVGHNTKPDNPIPIGRNALLFARTDQMFYVRLWFAQQLAHTSSLGSQYIYRGQIVLFTDSAYCLPAVKSAATLLPLDENLPVLQQQEGQIKSQRTIKLQS